MSCDSQEAPRPVDSRGTLNVEDAPSEPPALREMNATLRQAYERIRDLLARAGRDDVRSRYEVGVLVAEVKRSEHKYGARAVSVLGAALGTGVQTLYRCANVAEQWTSRQVGALLDKTSERGRPLSWSHLVALSAVSSDRRRAELADRTLSEGLSVRQLVGLAESNVMSRRKARGALEKLLTATERWWSLASALYEQISEELGTIAGADARALELLDAIIADHEAQQGRLAFQVERLRAERARACIRGVRKAESSSLETMADLVT
jgi:hypothetical protein